MMFYSVLHSEGHGETMGEKLGNFKTLDDAKEVLRDRCNYYKEEFKNESVEYEEIRNHDETYVVLTYAYERLHHHALWIIYDWLDD